MLRRARPIELGVLGLDLPELRARLAERYAPKAVNRYLSAVRGVLRAAPGASFTEPRLRSE